MGLVFRAESHCDIKCGSGVRPCLPSEAGIADVGKPRRQAAAELLGETEAGLGPQVNVGDRERDQDQKPFLLSLSLLRAATGTVSLKTLLKGPLKAGVGK